MTVKPLGKLLLLIVFVGLLAGGYRWYQSRSTASGGEVRLPRATGGSGGDTRQTTPGSSSGDDVGDTSAGGVELPLLTSGSKNDWLAEQAKKFNDANRGKYHVTTRLLETREAFQAILNDKEKPALWSTSSPIWAARLAQVWPQKHRDQEILDTGDDETFGVFLRTPMVFLTTKAKARTLRPLLEGGSP